MAIFTVKLFVKALYPSEQGSEAIITYNGLDAQSIASAIADARYHYEETSYYEGGFVIMWADVYEGRTRGKPLVSTE